MWQWLQRLLDRSLRQPGDMERVLYCAEADVVTKEIVRRWTETRVVSPNIDHVEWGVFLDPRTGLSEASFATTMKWNSFISQEKADEGAKWMVDWAAPAREKLAKTKAASAGDIAADSSYAMVAGARARSDAARAAREA